MLALTPKHMVVYSVARRHSHAAGGVAVVHRSVALARASSKRRAEQPLSLIRKVKVGKGRGAEGRATPPHATPRLGALGAGATTIRKQEGTPAAVERGGGAVYV